MYTAEIISNTVENGMLTVIVRYSDGKDTFDDTIQTNQKQSDTWLNDMIARRLKEVHGVVEMSPKVKLGPVDVITSNLNQEPSQVKGKLSPKEEYANDLKLFNKFLDAMRVGATDEKNAEFIALKAKLKKNFDSSYLDLF